VVQYRITENIELVRRLGCGDQTAEDLHQKIYDLESARLKSVITFPEFHIAYLRDHPFILLAHI
jgi:hypothetical protein